MFLAFTAADWVRACIEKSHRQLFFSYVKLYVKALIMMTVMMVMEATAEIFY